MATIVESYVRLLGAEGHTVGWIATWGPMANGDVGRAVPIQDSRDRSVQVVGTPGAGFNCAVEGSNDLVNFFVVHDPGLNLLNLTAAGGMCILEAVALMRPHITAGDGTTSVTVSIFMGRMNG